MLKQFQPSKSRTYKIVMVQGLDTFVMSRQSKPTNYSFKKFKNRRLGMRRSNHNFALLYAHYVICFTLVNVYF